MDVLKLAQEMQVPIIEADGLLFINALLKDIDAKQMLELGTAIGYSTSQFALAKDDLKIISIERNKEWFLVAEQVIEHYDLKNRVHLVFGDAFDFRTEEFFDLIFIDAAKAQYQKFFELFEAHLKPGGVIVCDNLHFHGLTNHPEEIQSRNLRALVTKINRFKEWLTNHESFETIFYDIADGLSVSRKKL